MYFLFVVGSYSPDAKHARHYSVLPVAYTRLLHSFSLHIGLNIPTTMLKNTLAPRADKMGINAQLVNFVEIAPY